MNENQSAANPSLSPTITLRKGTTEIEVKNAAAIIRRINEMYPNTDEYAWAGRVTPRSSAAAQHEKHKLWVESAKNWFKQEMFGGIGDFELIVKDQTEKEVAEARFSQKYDDAARKSDQSFNDKIVEEYENGKQSNTSKELLTDTQHPLPPVHTVNKNAYEIRSDILEQTLSWVKFKKDCHQQTSISDDDVIATAQKFYKFVENRR
jgi:hypothetical protein